MYRIKKEILINSTPKKVWEVFADIEKWPELCSYVSKVYWNTSKKWTLDSSFTQVIVNIIPLKKNVSHTKFIKIIPGKIVTWTGTRTLIKGVHTLKFKRINNAGKSKISGTNFVGKTKVSNIEYFKGPLAPIIFPFIKNRFEHYFEQFLKGLKGKVEKQKA